MGLADDIVALGSQAPAVVGSLVKVVKKVGPVLGTVQIIVDDPAFPQVVTKIRTLHEIEAAQAAAKPPSPTPSPTTPPMAPVGIGLHRVLPILDAVIYARRNPWAPWAVGAGLLLLIGGVGYRLGRRSRS